MLPVFFEWVTFVTCAMAVALLSTRVVRLAHVALRFSTIATCFCESWNSSSLSGTPMTRNRTFWSPTESPSHWSSLTNASDLVPMLTKNPPRVLATTLPSTMSKRDGAFLMDDP